MDDDDDLDEIMRAEQRRLAAETLTENFGPIGDAIEAQTLAFLQAAHEAIDERRRDQFVLAGAHISAGVALMRELYDLPTVQNVMAELARQGFGKPDTSKH